MSEIQRLEQRRAAEAWSCVQYVNEEIEDRSFKEKYSSTVSKVPSLILTNGLGQTLAFLRSKDEKGPERRVYEDLQGWLFRGDVIKWGTASQPELIERVMDISSDKYRAVTMEALSFLTWLKRFSDAVLPKEEDTL